MKRDWKKYLPVIALLLFVAAVIIALIIAQGVSRRAPIAPTAPERPRAAVCLLEFDIVPPVCNSTCTEDAQCGSGTICYITPSGETATSSGTATGSAQAAGFCRNPSCTESVSCLCATPSPTPTPTPSPTPSPTPTVQGGFFIRKYQDTNGNGSQQTGEPGLTWKFQWSQDGGNTWNDYQTDGSKLGEGGVITLPVGTAVKIREIAASGWTSTTATTVDLTIRANDNQLMVFGNWQPVASATPTPTPVAQCNSTCVTSSDCPTSMNCVTGFCRNPSCSTSTNCVCATVATTTPTPAPEELPKSGVIDDTLKLVGAGVGAIILGLIALLAL